MDPVCVTPDADTRAVAAAVMSEAIRIADFAGPVSGKPRPCLFCDSVHSIDAAGEDIASTVCYFCVGAFHQRALRRGTIE